METERKRQDFPATDRSRPRKRVLISEKSERKCGFLGDRGFPWRRGATRKTNRAFMATEKGREGEGIKLLTRDYYADCNG